MEEWLKFFQYDKSGYIKNDTFNIINNNYGYYYVEKEYEEFLKKDIKNIYLKEGVEIVGKNLLEFDFLYDKENILNEVTNCLSVYDFFSKNKLLPIGGTVSGDILCLKCCIENTNVYLWNHEVESEDELDGLVLLSNSFKELMENLIFNSIDVGDKNIGNVTFNMSEELTEMLKNTDMSKYK
jgi:hypothetical protein